MRSRRTHILLLLLGSVIVASTVGYLRRSSRWIVTDPVLVDRTATISPDYTDTVVPPNIAPLNFVIDHPADRYCVKISAPAGQPVIISGREPEIRIPPDQWQAMLQANRGGEFYIDIFVEIENRWLQYKRITNRIANQDIDGYMVYRLLRPVYSMYRMDGLGFYQRNLSTFEESLILRNDSINGGCLNCHTFYKNSPDKMLFHFRSGQYGSGSVLCSDETTLKLDTSTKFNASSAIYTDWHPDGEAIAFSSNKIRQFLHTVGENRELFDFHSDILIYTLKSNTVTTSPKISDPDRLETYPVWSPDGKWLYFCSAPQLPVERYKDVKYDLMRIAYDLETDTWGELETVISAAETNLSVTQPRFSPDGRFLVFCMCERGNFSIYQPSSDLYVLDIQTGVHRRLDINSDQTESWHGFSSNGRWMVFSSKRRDGLFARPYFTYLDSEGRFHKPLVMPQKNPRYYDTCINTYNLPSFVTGPVRLNSRQLAATVISDQATKAKLDSKLKSAIIPKLP